MNTIFERIPMEEEDYPKKTIFERIEFRETFPCEMPCCKFFGFKKLKGKIFCETHYDFLVNFFNKKENKK